MRKDFPDPLFSLAKLKKDPDLIVVATSVKTPPQLVSVDDTRITDILSMSLA